MSDTIIALLRARLPEHCVLHQEEDLRPYECDALSAYRQLPLAVVIPETLEQVRAILALCSEHRVPVVARGAGTGLSGGAIAMDDGVVISLARMNRILSLDPVNRVARVEGHVLGGPQPARAQPQLGQRVELDELVAADVEDAHGARPQAAFSSLAASRAK